MANQRAAVLLAGVCLLGCAVAAPIAAHADDCDDGEVSILVSPRAPTPGGRVRVLAASDVGAIGELAVTDGDGRVVSNAIERLGGPPWSAVVTVDPALAGTHRVEATRDGARVGCATFEVGGRAAKGFSGWNLATEALYSAWIEHLFDAPPTTSLSFDSLQEVLLDPQRNLLHDHLGLGEDGPNTLGQPPDCADMPYALRAYFGWKLGLPVAYRGCSRGTSSKPPSCGSVKTTTPSTGSDARGWYARAATEVMNTVHSGSARTSLADEATDFYPVALTRDALRPGTVYADPYGHTLMIVQWVAQTPERGGVLLAVDAQPDNSVARKRFWEGTFLFADDVASAGPGFKAFRPLVRTSGGALAPLSNGALRDDPRFAPFSLEQATLDPDAFYARVQRLINPDGLRPAQAYADTLDALVEQLQTRVDSVQRGEAYVRAHPRETIGMPEGLAIFETIGPWEDYATPSRDLRLLIAMKVLLGLPGRIVEHPELFLLDGAAPRAAAAAVEQAHASTVEERVIEYTRTDGSVQRLTVGEILARKPALEMAYNPNDCVEVRWGAPEGSPERSTCRRSAPPEQRARMASYRSWFREGRRPSR